MASTPFISKRRRSQSELLAEITNTESSATKRSSFAAAAGRLKEFKTPRKAPRGRHESSPPPDITVEDSIMDSTIVSPSPSPSLPMLSKDALHIVIKERAYCDQRASKCHQRRYECITRTYGT